MQVTVEGIERLDWVMILVATRQNTRSRISAVVTSRSLAHHPSTIATRRPIP